MTFHFSKLLLLAVGLISPLLLFSQVTPQQIVVHYTTASGKNVSQEVLLSDDPVVTFSKDSLTITYNGNNSSSFVYTNITDIDFKSLEPTGIASAKKSNSGKHRLVYLSHSKVKITGIDNSASVSLYNIGGGIVKANIYRDKDSITIDLSNLASGVYIIKTDQQSLKIIRK